MELRMLLFAILGIVVFLLRRKVSSALIGFFGFLKDISGNKEMILQLVKRDFKNKYLGSYLGLPWAFIQPAMNILVLWFVFTVGFKNSGVVHKYPFILWLICGMVPWFYVAELFQTGTGCILEYSFMIKKIVFRSSVIPLIKIITGLVIHAFFMIVIAVLFACNGYFPSLYWLQIPYYLLSLIVLLLGASWILSSVSVFVRDIPQIVNVSTQILFWLTPIFWSPDIIQGTEFGMILDLNPLYYVISGYRSAFMNEFWFWERPLALTAYFWIFAFAVFCLGALVFKKLRPHFADVL